MQNRWLLGLAVIPLVGFAVLAVPIVAQFGWTAYTPLTSVEPSFSPNTWVWTSTAVSVLSVAAAGVAYVVLTRRRGM